jgi:hypothetical protein
MNGCAAVPSKPTREENGDGVYSKVLRQAEVSQYALFRMSFCLVMKPFFFIDVRQGVSIEFLLFFKVRHADRGPVAECSLCYNNRSTPKKTGRALSAVRHGEAGGDSSSPRSSCTADTGACVRGRRTARLAAMRR